MPLQPQRIVCLCPSLTETLFALGLHGRIVGRTRYCVHPQPAVAAVPVIGGTKTPDVDAIARVRPDLVIAEKEENRREDVERLAGEYPVFVFDIRSVTDALASLRRLGEICGTGTRGNELADRINGAWGRIPTGERPLRVLYLIWRKPWMAAGRDTYIGSVLDRLGLVNVAAGEEGRYPALDEGRLADLRPDLCLLSSEPFPFEDKHIDELMPLLPGTRFEHVDGEMFSWYGARMLPAAAYLEALLARRPFAPKGAPTSQA